MARSRDLKSLFFYKRKEVTRNLRSYRKRIDQQDKDIVFLCIGSDRSTGDSLGPLVGTRLKELGFENVYGTIKYPIHALNMRQRLKEIEEKHPNRFVIAIDASIGSSENLFGIRIKTRPLEPGIGVGKKFSSVGDMSIIGVVCSEEEMRASYFSFNTVRLSNVFDVVNEIVDTCIYLRKTALSEEVAIARDKKN
jgi:putative sporulation protein YyaC